jgi:predicted secreted protein
MVKYFLLLSITIISCSDSRLITEAEVDASVNGKRVEISINQKLTLKLDVHADGGYMWNCEVYDTSVVVQDSINYKPKNISKNIVGGLSVAAFYFTGRKAGQTEIKLIEYRSWEKDIAPINTIQFLVIVK